MIQSISTGVQKGPDVLISRDEDVGRSKNERRKYAGDPHSYFRDILGWFLTPQQEGALETIEENDRVLVPSGNNLGKTFLLSGYSVYRFDAVAALEDEDRGLDEQGSQILLPGPDHQTIFSTIYAGILEHALRAEKRGYPMPGKRSERSVHWRVRPRWFMEPFAPSVRVEQDIAHSASGRHHRNQVATIEEGQGVQESLWKAVEGMCSSAGNKIISAFNPSEPVGPAYQRALQGGWRVTHMCAFDHPNVRGRQVVVPDAISYRVIDARVMNECRNRGKYPDTQPDTMFGDFIYALPPSLDSEERGEREDGELGHADGQLRVYRPTPAFEAQVLGEWPRSMNTGLFDPGSIDSASKRWSEREKPEDAPDRVGVDVAREGDDESCACPSWGTHATDLLRDWRSANVEHDVKTIAEMLENRRIYVGEIVTAPKGDGPTVARWMHDKFPHSPMNVDETGVGASVYDHLAKVLEAPATAVSFAMVPTEKLPDEVICLNNRAAMYVRAAKLVQIGMVDMPKDVLLREELLAHEIIYTEKVVPVKGSRKKQRKPAIRIMEKDKVKKKIGRSPDRADAFVLSLFSGDYQAVWNVW
jgi:hypothetical protein